MGVRKRGQGYVILRRMYTRYTAYTAFYGVTKVENNVRGVPYCLEVFFVWGEHIGNTPNFLPKVLAVVLIRGIVPRSLLIFGNYRYLYRFMLGNATIIPATVLEIRTPG